MKKIKNKTIEILKGEKIMAYTKKTWVDYPDTSTPITADDLNNIEDGIETNDTAITAISGGDVAQTYPALSGGFTNVSGYETKYIKANGTVYISGVLSAGTGSNGATIFTLPVGCRPAKNSRFPTITSGEFGYIDVNADGTVVFAKLVNTYSSTVFAIFRAV